MSGAALRVCALYPDRLNIYADRGNLRILERRCSWRGIGFDLTEVSVGDRLDPDGHDLVYLGGGQDSDQRECARDLQAKAGALMSAADRGAVVLGVCGGYQLLGHEYRMGDENLPGVGLLDATTVAGPTRLVGHAAAEVDLGAGPQVLAGFENHRGRTELGPGAEPLGRVLHGFGNNGRDGGEGARQGTVIGTYLHGPLLAPNVWLADWLIAAALGRDDLPSLDDELETRVASRALRAAQTRERSKASR